MGVLGRATLSIAFAEGAQRVGRKASHFRRASSRLKNKLAFRHSERNLQLNDSMKALSVGLPGRENSSATPRMKAHSVQLLADKLWAVVDADRLR